jgi:hypothetical protein
MTVENSNAVEEEIEVQIVEDPPEGGRSATMTSLSATPNRLASGLIS